MPIGFTTFSEYADASLPSDWINVLGQGNLFTKESSGSFAIDYLDKPSVSNFSFAGPVVTEEGTATTVEVFARVRINSSVSTDMVALCLNQVVLAAGPDLHVQLIPGTPGSLSFVHGVTNKASGSTGFPVVLDQWYNIRARWEVANALLFAKVWEDGASEQAAWDIDGVAYTDIGDRGAVGFGGQWFNKNQCDAFGWATDGETAPSSPPVGPYVANITLAQDSTIDIVVPVPAGALDDDLLLMFAAFDNSFAGLLTHPVPPFVQEAFNLMSGNAGDTFIYSWLVDAAPAADYTWSMGFAEEWVAGMLLIKNVNAAAFLDVAVGHTGQSSGANPTAPSVTTVTDKTMVLRSTMMDGGGVTKLPFTPVGSELSHVEIEELTEIVLKVVSELQASAGATGTFAFVPVVGDQADSYTVALASALTGEVQAAASIEAELPPDPGQVQVDASMQTEVHGLVAVDASMQVAFVGEVSVVASIVASQNAEVNVVSSVEVLQNGQVQVAASMSAEQKPGEVFATASIEVIQNGAVQETVSVEVLQNGVVQVTASMEVFFSGEVTAASSVEVSQTGEVSADASIQTEVHGLVSADASVAASQNSEVDVASSMQVAFIGQVSAVASIEVQQRSFGEVFANASMQTKVHGLVSADASAIASQNSEVDAASSIEIKQNGAVQVISSVEVHFFGAVQITSSMEVAQTGEVQVDASLVTGKKGEVVADASINAAQNGIIPIIVSIFVAQNGTVQVVASVSAIPLGAVQVDGSVVASQNAAVTVDASIGVQSRIDGQVQVAVSIAASQNGLVQVAASVQAISLGAVIAPASIVLSQNAQVTVPVSISVLQGGGEIQIAASITVSQHAEVQIVASVQAQPFVFVDGQVQVAVSMQADHRIGLDDRSGVAQKAYIPNSGRFVIRDGTLFIVDNETLRARQEAAEGFGWDIDLITNPPGELVVDTNRPGSVPLQYKIDRDGGQFGMGVLRIEIPDDWLKT